MLRKGYIMKIKYNKEIKWHIVFIIIILILLYPILYALSTSFKSLNEAYNNILSLIPEKPTTSAYKRVLSIIPFARITLNTFIIASVVTLFKLFTSILAAYSFVFFDFKGKKVLYFILISTIFIPFTVTMIPNYITV